MVGQALWLNWTCGFGACWSHLTQVQPHIQTSKSDFDILTPLCLPHKCFSFFFFLLLTLISRHLFALLVLSMHPVLPLLTSMLSLACLGKFSFFFFYMCLLIVCLSFIVLVSSHHPLVHHPLCSPAFPCFLLMPSSLACSLTTCKFFVFYIVHC